MPKLAIDALPAYRLHKQSGQAIVTLSGRDILLGEHGTPESRAKYTRVTTEWMNSGRQLRSDSAATIAMLIEAYWRHVTAQEGRDELAAIKTALAHVRRLYEWMAANQFGPLALKTVRQEMVNSGKLSRGYINKQIRRIRSMFGWATENEFCPGVAEVFHALQAIKGLKRGRTTAREPEAVKPVPQAHVDAVLPLVSRQVKAMIEVQTLTGMRPGEVCQMRTRDIDTSGREWLYLPATHKTANRGLDRLVWIGPRAQKLLQPFLRTDLQAHIFQPVEAEEERRAAAAATKAAERKHDQDESPAPKAKKKAAPKKPAANPRRAGARYTTGSYRRAIARACEVAFSMPADIRPNRADTPEERQQRSRKRSTWRKSFVWHPNQLRHNAATQLRKAFGLDAAQAVLGHAEVSVTQVYAERNAAAAKAAMAKIG